MMAARSGTAENTLFNAMQQGLRHQQPSTSVAGYLTMVDQGGWDIFSLPRMSPPFPGPATLLSSNRPLPLLPTQPAICL